jgi:hypothetical protein
LTPPPQFACSRLPFRPQRRGRSCSSMFTPL